MIWLCLKRFFFKFLLLEEETEEADPPPPPSIQTKIPASDGDPNYFENVKDGVHRILKKEKMQEEYQKVRILFDLLTTLWFFIWLITISNKFLNLSVFGGIK